MKSFFTSDKNQRPTDLNTQAVVALQLSLPGASLADTKTSNNTFNLTGGTFAKYVPRTDDTVLAGNNTYMAGLTSNRRMAVSGIHFTDTVTIQVGGKVVFQNCYFSHAVVVNSGGKAVFTNCIFAANVQNAGLAVNVGVIGCCRLGVAHVGCTVLFEIT